MLEGRQRIEVKWEHTISHPRASPAVIDQTCRLLYLYFQTIRLWLQEPPCWWLSRQTVRQLLEVVLEQSSQRDRQSAGADWSCFRINRLFAGAVVCLCSHLQTGHR